MPMQHDYEIMTSDSPAAFRNWLSNNVQKQEGVWLRIYKKASGIKSITYAEALDEALCHGWIDGIKKSYDELSYIQKFTPRRKQSVWSKRNIEHIQRLRISGKMTTAGEAEVVRAMQDGRWDAAYDAPSSMTVPEYFIRELDKHEVAKAVFQKLNKSEQYTIVRQLQTARNEAIRARRIKKTIESLLTNQ